MVSVCARVCIYGGDRNRTCIEMEETPSHFTIASVHRCMYIYNVYV